VIPMLGVLTIHRMKLHILTFIVSNLILSAFCQEEAMVFHKKLQNDISISVFEMNRFPNADDHTQWKINDAQNGGAVVYKLNSVKDYSFQLSDSVDKKSITVWTNREWNYQMDVPGPTNLQECVIYDAALIGENIYLCYRSGFSLKIDSASIKLAALSAKQIGGFELARLPIGGYGMITNATFSISPNNTPILVAEESDGKINCKYFWEFNNNKWVVKR